MAALTDYQYELGGLVFGHGTDILVEDVDGLGLGEYRPARFPLPAEDGQTFGREYRTGRSIVFEGNVVKSGDPGEAFDLAAELGRAFDGGSVRRVARAVEALRLSRPGSVTRVLYGRPERFDTDVRRSVIGLIGFMASFQTADPRLYSDTDHTTTLGLVTASNGGIVTVDDGLPSPITTLAGTRRTTLIENQGDTDTWPVIQVHGPVTNPTIALGNGIGGVLWNLEYLGSVAFDQTVTFDTRPWSRGVYLGDGSSLGGSLSRRSRPSQSSIPPGEWEFIVGGIDGTGTAEFDITWRDAFTTY